MKICKQCKAAQADEARFCNLCGAPMEGDEEILEETAEIAEEEAAAVVCEEESAEEAVEDVTILAEEPVMAEKKKTPWGWIIGLAAAVVLIVALILLKGNAGSVKPVALDAALHNNAYGYESYSIHYETDENGVHTYSYRNADGELIAVTPESVDAIMDQVVATVGIVELTNRDLAYYYDQQFYYFYSMYSNLLPQLMDTTLALDEQMGVTGVTWQRYFVDNALSMFHQVAALYQAATEEGFLLTEAQQAELDASLDLQAQAESFGYEDAAAFMKDYFGPYATVESYQAFMRMNAVVGHYAAHLVEQADATEEEAEAYFDANAEEFLMNYGIEKIDKNVVNVRHILLQPAAAEDGTISDEAWAAAEAEANAIYEEWLAGAATEESFAELATAHTADPGSQSTGGLYTDVYPGQMVPEFNDWCFADGRQVGDHTIVKTSYGYHIMFFSGEGDYVYWRMAAMEMLLNERATEARTARVEATQMETDESKLAILDSTVPSVPAAEEPAAAEDEHTH